MLEQVGEVFQNYQALMEFRTAKKSVYEEYMRQFQRNHGHLLREMTDYVEMAEDKERAADEVADAFLDATEKQFQKRGRISGRVKADLGFFMIYYVFPAILLTGQTEARRTADHLRDTWNRRMKEKLTYADYDTIHASFQDKLFGIIPLERKQV